MWTFRHDHATIACYAVLCATMLSMLSSLYRPELYFTHETRERQLGILVVRREVFQPASSATFSRL